MLFACTCAADPSAPAERVPAGLRGLTAVRAALQLTGELARDEHLWERALGQRYDSVRHRYARRTTWRNRGLADLMRDNGAVQRAVTARLQRWLTEGGRLAALAGELEAALVHERTPARFA
jgi:2-polyprenyl-6-methoxyphenol hydroxylase-like FAD-dependent oxidoreductase